MPVTYLIYPAHVLTMSRKSSTLKSLPPLARDNCRWTLADDGLQPRCQSYSKA